jgi:hypothetical protein
MAVTFVIGNMNQLDSLSLFEAANSITSALANEFAEAGEGLHQASLIYLGLVLFFITFVVLSLSKVVAGAAARRAKGSVMNAVTHRFLRPLSQTRLARYNRRKRVNQIALTSVAGRHGVRPVLAGVDFVGNRAPGWVGWCWHLHADDAATQRSRRYLANAIYGSC